jgi:hypothetical protein
MADKPLRPVQPGRKKTPNPYPSGDDQSRRVKRTTSKCSGGTVRGTKK